MRSSWGQSAVGVIQIVFVISIFVLTVLHCICLVLLICCQFINFDVKMFLSILLISSRKFGSPSGDVLIGVFSRSIFYELCELILNVFLKTECRSSSAFFECRSFKTGRLTC